MLWSRLRTFFVTVVILVAGTAALALSYESFLAMFPSTKLAEVNNAAALYGLLALTYAPFAVAIILFGVAVGYALSLHSRVCSFLFLVLSGVLVAGGMVRYASQGPYALVGTAVLNQRTYHLINASEYREARFTSSLCECAISNLACQCHQFYRYSTASVGTDFSLVPDWGADEMQVWLNGKLLYVDGSPPRCFTQTPAIKDACID
jgi:hypothetical protein